MRISRRPHEEKDKEEREKMEEIRGSPLAVGSLEEMIDDTHAIVSSSVGPEYYVSVRGAARECLAATPRDDDGAPPPRRRRELPNTGHVLREPGLIRTGLLGVAP